ncbi:penicillin acylase [Streptomyces sp. SID14478]|uniref:penicillin acylase family protein n=1 Tax=Streptomyces sp. SID14478 TaxID=2706073 RepID=UPI0013E01270|nr:penicillin acylase family protein [Streptomyces sp. SID14478]NEB81943.1 penicillin acylase [Streptomyces sp. SID14478]
MTIHPRHRRRRLAGALGAGLLLAAVAMPQANADAGASADGRAGVSLTSLRHGSVTIKRDKWGGPNIYSASTFGLFYGYGYAAAQDRLFQLDMTRRGAEGTVSEVLGADYADFDSAVRGNVDIASVRAQYADLSSRDRDILDGYARGLNTWIDTALADRGKLLPKEYGDFGFEPKHWTGLDVAMVTVGTMAIRFSDYTAELDNLTQLHQLEAKFGKRRGREAFDQLHWAVDPKAPSTLSAADRSGASARAKSPAALPGSGSVNGLHPGAPTATLSPEQQLPHPAKDKGTAGNDDARAAVTEQLTALWAPARQPRFSNMMLVGEERARGAESLMLNGPQFGSFNPSYVYEVGLHGAGFDVVGNTPFAYPVVLFGHNADISWGATAGNGDTVDIYQEHLDPADRLRYRYKGAYRRMTTRTETVRVKGGADRTVDVQSTVHGPVVAVDADRNVAYTKKRSWAGKELESLFAWVDSTQARNHAAWEKQARRLAISINWYYSDRHGNIGYFFAGHFPDRPAGQDRRLPADGTGTMEWRGMQPTATANPHVLNPQEGWLANWNNSPAPGYPNSDFTPWARADRVVLLQKQLAAKKSISADELWQMMKNAALTDVNADWFRPLIRKATTGLPADSPERRVSDALARWNGRNTDDDRDGHYDSPGTAVMRTWLTSALADTLGKSLPEKIAANYTTTEYPEPGKPTPGSQHVTAGGQVLYNALLGRTASVPQRVNLLDGRNATDVIRKALRSTASSLTDTYKTSNSADWLAPTAPHTFGTSSYLGVPMTDDGAELSGPVYMNRGTENDLMVATSDRITGYDVMPPGQSGFTAPDGTRSPHYSDQLDLYVNWQHKPTYFTKREVDDNLRSTQRLSFLSG